MTVQLKNRSLWTPAQGIDTVLPAWATRGYSVRGMERVNLRELGILPGVAGGAQGVHQASDVVTRTADGTDLNVIWDEFMALLNAVNGQRQGIINFLTFNVTNPTELVAQPGTGIDFEEATEFGEPVGSRVQPAYFSLGYTFKWYDLAARYTWMYLADATTAMVESVANAAVEAYYRKLMFEVLKTIFNPTNLTATINQQSYNVYKFYNNDGTVPPTYKSNTFLGTHNHYKTTGAATIAPDDLDVLVIDDFASHGYSLEEGYRLVAMVNTAVGNTIRGFRAGTASARYDFIPAVGQPGQIMALNQQIVGANQPANSLDGLTVIGSYGPLLIVQDDWMPTTHVIAFATGGPQSLNNPVGLRQHANSNLQGLRLIKGRTPDYPLIDSFWATGFGTGIRQRGGGIVLEITADASYEAPAAYV